SIGNKFEFSQLRPGAEITFRVETALLENHESQVPVLGMTYGNDEIVPPNEDAEFQFRKRMALLVVSVTLLLLGARQANRVRKLYLKECEEPSDDGYDPLLLTIARMPRELMALVAILVMVAWLIVVPLAYAHIGFVLVAGGYGT